VRALVQSPAFLIPAVVLGVIAGGLYTLVPGLAYVLVAAAGACLLLDKSFAASPVNCIGRDKLAGFALFNLFFVLHTLPHLPALQEHEPVRTLYLHVLSIGMYLLALTFGRLALVQSTYAEARYDARSRQLCTILPLAGLALLLLGQIGQLIPALEREARELADVVYILSRRPGGFFNPNMTAAIALVLLFIANETPWRSRPPRHLQPAVILATLVVLLSQSRIGIIALLTYELVFLSRKVLLTTVLLIAAAICLTLLIDREFGRLASKLIGRFAGDYSSSERLELLGRGLTAFLDAPLLGNGYRYVALTAGQSTHNQLVEILASFGLAGLAAMGLATYLLYGGGSARFLLVCIAPTFLFSHNFYETVSYQTALGLAYAVDRTRAAVAGSESTG
jgi:hypothetical protein